MDGRNQAGQFVEKASLKDVLEVFDAVDGPPVVTSADVAEATGLSRDSARRKLRALYDQGRIGQRKSAGRVLYWRADWDDVDDTGSDTRDTPPRESGPREDHGADSEARDRSDGRTPASDSTPSQRDTAPESERAGSVATRDGPIATVEFPGGRDRGACEAAVYAARDYLRDHGPASMRVLVSEVMPAHPLGYDVPDLEEGDRFRGAWWRRVVKPGLEALPDVDSPGPGQSEWRYVGGSED